MKGEIRLPKIRLGLAIATEPRQTHPLPAE